MPGPGPGAGVCHEEQTVRDEHGPAAPLPQPGAPGELAPAVLGLCAVKCGVREVSWRRHLWEGEEETEEQPLGNWATCADQAHNWSLAW